MPYGADPLNDPLDAIRRSIGDVGDTPQFSDDEISYYYVQYGNVLLAASYAASDLAALYASRVSKSISGDSISNDQLFQHYTALAERLQKQCIDRTVGSFAVPSAAQIGVIRDSLPSNFPARQRLSDIQEEPFGVNEQ